MLHRSLALHATRAATVGAVRRALLAPSRTYLASASIATTAANTDANGADRLLVINAGSSTLKYKMFALERDGVGAPVFSGLVELSTTTSKEGRIIHKQLATSDASTAASTEEVRLELPTHRTALEEAVKRFFRADAQRIRAIGHRVVHGGETFHDATQIDDAVLAAIDANSSLAPLHNPGNLLGIAVATEVFGSAGQSTALPQVAVFDTAFHAKMPPRAYMYAVPYSLYTDHAVRRYGFHGTSHQFVATQAATILNKPLADCCLITCHLGNGASIAAIRDGKSVDTSMGLTPLDGLVMGTRSGDVDPALHAFLATHCDLSITEIDALLNKHSGLLGLCGESDVRKIQDMIKKGDARADLAIDVFVHRVRKYIGAYLLELGGSLDAIVFTAGVGEHSALIRARVCRDLAFVGIELDADKNAQSTLGAGPIEIQAAASRVKVLVIPTDEERSIAEQTFDVALRV